MSPYRQQSEEPECRGGVGTWLLVFVLLAGAVWGGWYLATHPQPGAAHPLVPPIGGER